MARPKHAALALAAVASSLLPPARAGSLADIDHVVLFMQGLPADPRRRRAAEARG